MKIGWVFFWPLPVSMPRLYKPRSKCLFAVPDAYEGALARVLFPVKNATYLSPIQWTGAPTNATTRELQRASRMFPAA